MEKFPINAGNGSRLASLIEHRLRGDQQLFLVSIGSAESAASAERQKARNELLALFDEMRRNVASSGVSESELGDAIDETIVEVRASRK